MPRRPVRPPTTRTRRGPARTSRSSTSPTTGWSTAASGAARAPGVAESWELAADGSTLTRHLREGLSVGDGTPVPHAWPVHAGAGGSSGTSVCHLHDPELLPTAPARADRAHAQEAP